MAKLILLTGWGGIFLSSIAIACQNTSLFLVAQVVASVSAFLWSRYLQGKRVTIDLVLSLGLSVFAAIVKEPFIMYAAMLVRSVSYQFQFMRYLKLQDK